MLALRFDADTGTMIALSNLCDEPCIVDLSDDLRAPTRVVQVFADDRYTTHPKDVAELDLNGWGYRWLRIVP